MAFLGEEISPEKSLLISNYPNQTGLFGLSIDRGGGMCPQDFPSYFSLVFHQKSAKHGLK